MKLGMISETKSYQFPKIYNTCLFMPAIIIKLKYNDSLDVQTQILQYNTNQTHSGKSGKRKFIRKINGLFLPLIFSVNRGRGNDTFHKIFKNQCISEKSRLNSLFLVEVIVILRFPSPTPSPQHPCPPAKLTTNFKSYL